MEAAKSIKARKPYTITKQRERWTEDEHTRFLEALRFHGRNWKRIQDAIGTKTAVQCRSHAQKFFSKLERQKESGNTVEDQSIDIPPPRAKRKPSRPYPRSNKGPATPPSSRARDNQDSGLGEDLDEEDEEDTADEEEDTFAGRGKHPRLEQQHAGIEPACSFRTQDPCSQGQRQEQRLEEYAAAQQDSEGLTGTGNGPNRNASGLTGNTLGGGGQLRAANQQDSVSPPPDSYAGNGSDTVNRHTSLPGSRLVVQHHPWGTTTNTTTNVQQPGYLRSASPWTAVVTNSHCGPPARAVSFSSKPPPGGGHPSGVLRQQSSSSLTAVRQQGPHAMSVGEPHGMRCEEEEVSEVTVAAVAAAASAAAAAAAAAVVAAAGQQVQAHLQNYPLMGFPFFGLSPSLLAALSLTSPGLESLLNGGLQAGLGPPPTVVSQQQQQALAVALTSGLHTHTSGVTKAWHNQQASSFDETAATYNMQRCIVQPSGMQPTLPLPHASSSAPAYTCFPMMAVPPAAPIGSTSPWDTAGATVAGAETVADAKDVHSSLKQQGLAGAVGLPVVHGPDSSDGVSPCLLGTGEAGAGQGRRVRERERPAPGVGTAAKRHQAGAHGVPSAQASGSPRADAHVQAGEISSNTEAAAGGDAGGSGGTGGDVSACAAAWQQQMMHNSINHLSTGCLGGGTGYKLTGSSLWSTPVVDWARSPWPPLGQSQGLAAQRHDRIAREHTADMLLVQQQQARHTRHVEQGTAGDGRLVGSVTITDRSSSAEEGEAKEAGERQGTGWRGRAREGDGSGEGPSSAAAASPDGWLHRMANQGRSPCTSDNVGMRGHEDSSARPTLNTMAQESSQQLHGDQAATNVEGQGTTPNHQGMEQQSGACAEPLSRVNSLNSGERSRGHTRPHSSRSHHWQDAGAGCQASGSGAAGVSPGSKAQPGPAQQASSWQPQLAVKPLPAGVASGCTPDGFDTQGSNMLTASVVQLGNATSGDGSGSQDAGLNTSGYNNNNNGNGHTSAAHELLSAPRDGSDVANGAGNMSGGVAAAATSGPDGNHDGSHGQTGAGQRGSNGSGSDGQTGAGQRGSNGSGSDEQTGAGQRGSNGSGSDEQTGAGQRGSNETGGNHTGSDGQTGAGQRGSNEMGGDGTGGSGGDGGDGTGGSDGSGNGQERQAGQACSAFPGSMVHSHVSGFGATRSIHHHTHHHRRDASTQAHRRHASPPTTAAAIAPSATAPSLHQARNASHPVTSHRDRRPASPPPGAASGHHQHSVSPRRQPPKGRGSALAPLRPASAPPDAPLLSVCERPPLPPKAHGTAMGTGADGARMGTGRADGCSGNASAGGASIFQAPVPMTGDSRTMWFLPHLAVGHGGVRSDPGCGLATAAGGQAPAARLHITPLNGVPPGGPGVTSMQSAGQLQGVQSHCLAAHTLMPPPGTHTLPPVCVGPSQGPFPGPAMNEQQALQLWLAVLAGGAPVMALPQQVQQQPPATAGVAAAAATSVVFQRQSQLMLQQLGLAAGSGGSALASYTTGGQLPLQVGSSEAAGPATLDCRAAPNLGLPGSSVVLFETSVAAAALMGATPQQLQRVQQLHRQVQQLQQLQEAQQQQAQLAQQARLAQHVQQLSTQQLCGLQAELSALAQRETTGALEQEMVLRALRQNAQNAQHMQQAHSFALGILQQQGQPLSFAGAPRQAQPALLPAALTDAHLQLPLAGQGWTRPASGQGSPPPLPAGTLAATRSPVETDNGRPVGPRNGGSSSGGGSGSRGKGGSGHGRRSHEGGRRPARGQHQDPATHVMDTQGHETHVTDENGSDLSLDVSSAQEREAAEGLTQLLGNF